MQIRTAFPRFQEYFTLTIEFRDKKISTQKAVGKMYVGKYFTSTGEYDEVRCMLLYLCYGSYSCVFVLSARIY